MSNLINFYLSPIIKVKAKRYQVNQDGSIDIKSCKFNINAQNTSYDLLRILLVKYCEITGEFTISYRNKNNDFVLLESNSDLERAFTKAYYHSHLYLMVKSQPLEGAFDEWDFISPSEIPLLEPRRCSQRRDSLMGSFLNHVEKTMVKVSRAFSFESSPEGDCDKMPMTIDEFETFLDSEGRLVKPHEFHLTVYRGGIEPSLRPIAWMHLLNVFPEGMTSKEKELYLKSKEDEYYSLKYSWQRLMNEGEASETLKDITNLVLKDVRRTDRNEKFYSGSDDNKNVQFLFSILTTYAFTHSNVYYCQGMSDLLSPILFVVKDEAYAYIAFCGLLNRLQTNFKADGRSIRTKFRHLRRMLFYYDRELFMYLKDQGVSSLLFCYRWLLLELKREFPYNEALHMLEVMWGSLPPKAPEKELELCDAQFLNSYNSTNNAIVRSPRSNLIWINNYYSESMMQKTDEFPRLLKSAWKKGTESRVKEVSWKMDSVVEREIKIPVHYRRRRYRSYINRKLSRLSLSSKDEEVPLPKQNPDRLNICQTWAYGDDFEHHSFKINTAVVTAREFLRSQWCYSNTVNEIQLNNWLNGKWWESMGTPEKFNDFHSVVATLRQRHGSSDSNYSTTSANSDCLLSDSEYHGPGSSTTKSCGRSHRSRSEGYESDPAFSSKEYSAEEDSDDSDAEDEGGGSETEGEAEDEAEEDDDDDADFYSRRLVDSMVGKKYEEALTYFHRKKELLPPPHALGDGNPFLLFLCVTMIMQQRDKILKNQMDVNELCMYFDKMVRSHKLSKTINKARTLFGEYLNMGWDEDLSDSDDDFLT